MTRDIDTTVSIKSILETLEDDGGFTVFIRALKKTGLDLVLHRGEGPYTVFAPPDEAFSTMSEETCNDLFGNREFLTGILRYHILPDRVTTATMRNNQALTTLHGDDVSVATMGGITVNDANVINPDIECTNGVVHVIDTMLIPHPTATIV